jgi:hypothetical protein
MGPECASQNELIVVDESKRHLRDQRIEYLLMPDALLAPATTATGIEAIRQLSAYAPTCYGLFRPQIL